jgi:hypothetical protein
LKYLRKKDKLNDLLNSYNLYSVIHFPTRITKNSKTAIDNIFLDFTKMGNFTTSPVSNGLSDHDAQIIEICIKNLNVNKVNHKVKNIRKITNYSIMEFKNKLSEESWQSIFENTSNDVNNKFNIFLNIYLQIFHSSFPIRKVCERQSTNQWITKGIMNSCKRKKELYMEVRSNNNLQLKNYYLKYNKILAKVIKTAKKVFYNNKIKQVQNKIKATWEIIKSDIGAYNGKVTKYD